MASKGSISRCIVIYLPFYIILYIFKAFEQQRVKASALPFEYHPHRLIMCVRVFIYTFAYKGVVYICK